MAVEVEHVRHEIDGRAVSQREFEALLATLTEVRGTWFCAETKDGGETGYDAQGPDGVTWEYRARSGAESVASLTRGVELPPERGPG